MCGLSRWLLGAEVGHVTTVCNEIIDIEGLNIISTVYIDVIAIMVFILISIALSPGIEGRSRCTMFD